MKHLIITADDYGVFPAVNEGIIDAVNKDRVNSVAVLSNFKGSGSKYPDSLTNVRALLERTAEKNPEIGCHLTVTSGKPLTGSKMEFARDDNGNFFSFGNYRNYKEPEQLKLLFEELCAQVEELASVPGVTVKHLTNHHNALTLFAHHFDVYLRVANKFRLPMRSADVRPKGKQSLYKFLLDRMLTGDVPKKDREDMMEFQSRIAREFKRNSLGVKSTDFLESSHYGPVGLLPAARLAKFWLVSDKHATLDAFFRQFLDSQEQSVELLLHVAKPGWLTVDKSKDLDYAGVDRSYFDSRVIEYKSIIEYELEKWTGVQRRGWSF